MGFRREQLSARVGELSGGQRRRLQLMLTLLDEPNVLVLDEPTNDVDIDMLSATEDLLDSWPGTLIVVSHDRYLLERVTDQQYAILDGHLRHLPGGVDEYLRIVARRQAAADAGTGRPHRPAARRRHCRARNCATCRRRSPHWTARWASWPDKVNAKHVELAEHDQSDHVGIGRLTSELRELEAEVADKENRWLELSELRRISRLTGLDVIRHRVAADQQQAARRDEPAIRMLAADRRSARRSHRRRNCRAAIEPCSTSE